MGQDVEENESKREIADEKYSVSTLSCLQQRKISYKLP
jgi:hypothetical protein